MKKFAKYAIRTILIAFATVFVGTCSYHEFLSPLHNIKYTVRLTMCNTEHTKNITIAGDENTQFVHVYSNVSVPYFYTRENSLMGGNRTRDILNVCDYSVIKADTISRKR